jgi:hypothetical protein
MTGGAGLSEKEKKRMGATVALGRVLVLMGRGPRPTGLVLVEGLAAGSRAAVRGRSGAALGTTAPCGPACAGGGSFAAACGWAPCGLPCAGGGGLERGGASARFAGGGHQTWAPRASVDPTLRARGDFVQERPALGAFPRRRRLGREGRRRVGATKRVLRATSAQMCSPGLGEGEGAAVGGSRARTRKKGHDLAGELADGAAQGGRPWPGEVGA